jgi:hypothetical protein
VVILDDQLVPAGRPAKRWSPGAGVVHASGVQAVLRVVLDVLREDRAEGLRTAAFVSGYRAELEARLAALVEHSSKGGPT